VRWGKSARAVVFTILQSCCPSAASLFGQLLPQQSGIVWFWMLLVAQEISSGIYYLPCFGRWLVALPLLSVFAAFPVFLHLEFGTESWFLAPSPFSGAGSVFHPHLHSWCLITILCLCFSVLLGGFSLLRGCTGLYSQGVCRGVTHSGWCSPVHFANSCRSRFGACSSGEKWYQLFSVQHSMGRLFTGLWLRMSQNLILIDALS
jgi:hypothetical protein